MANVTNGRPKLQMMEPLFSVWMIGATKKNRSKFSIRKSLLKYLCWFSILAIENQHILNKRESKD